MLGAALAYRTAFSLAPWLPMVISIAGLVFGADVVRGVIFGQRCSTLGNAAAADIENWLDSMSKPTEGITADVIRAAALLMIATAAFREILDVLNRFWRLEP